GVFAGNNFTSVVIPDNIKSIGAVAFANCYLLAKITIPSSVTSIGDRAFSQCPSLTRVACNAQTPPTLGYEVFSWNNNLKIYVPSGSLDLYKATQGWSQYTDIIFGI
ncbi:MAG: leucine-rich repeat domain-containing protein, partial [Bacteroidales bacterium]|nr:leucine-rich repeat domain-containing protein [Bacteroidales bacterium]